MGKTVKAAGKKVSAQLLDYLDRQFKGRKIELGYTNCLEMLVATILSAQCTDVRVNQVTPDLFRRYSSARAFAEAELKSLEQMIRSTGFYKAKARNIRNCCRILVERHGGRVPDRMEDLVALPGVGRKTANVVLGNCFGRPAIVVDTHVKRVSRRLGLTRWDDPVKIEQDLAALFPPGRWTAGSHQLLLHGRYICKARRPNCGGCQIYRICAWKEKSEFAGGADSGADGN